MLRDCPNGGYRFLPGITAFSSGVVFTFEGFARFNDGYRSLLDEWGILVEEILRPAGAAAIHGVRWFPSRPPILGLEFEVDLRGVLRELVL